jgi:hypothetical protein
MDRKYRWQIQDVPANLRRAAKSEAVRRGMTTGAWVAEAIRNEIDRANARRQQGEPAMFANLDQLYEGMINDDPNTHDRHGQWSSDLPTFGGEDAYSQGVWSWDETRLIVGTCADDLEIVNREDWAERRNA